MKTLCLWSGFKNASWDLTSSFVSDILQDMSLRESLSGKNLKKTAVRAGLGFVATAMVATACDRDQKPASTLTPDTSTSTAQVIPTAEPLVTPTPLVEKTNDISCVLPTIPQLMHVEGSAPLTTSLMGGASAGRSGVGIMGYQWDFDGNGTWDSGVQLDPTDHVYEKAGTYNPRFRVRGSDGSWGQTCESFPITVLESTKEIKTDVEFVSSVLEKYLKLDADGQGLKDLKDPEHIDRVLRKIIGEAPTVREVPSGNFDPKEDAVYIVDGIWVSRKGNETTMSFTMDENGKIVRSQKGEDLLAKIPWSTVEQGNLDTAKNLNRVVTHEPTDWNTIDEGVNYEGSKAIGSSVRLLSDGTKIKYQIINNSEKNLPYVVIFITLPHLPQETP